MTIGIERIAALLLIASLVSLIARRLRVPYTVGLVFGGVVVAVMRLPIDIGLSKQLIFSVFLPPLIFEAALQIPWKGFRRDLPITITLATAGVLISAAIVSAGARFFLGWPWQAALLIGVILSATDPVSVIAAFKEAGVQGRLALLVETESLLNDGTAAVLFNVAVAILAASRFVPHASAVPGDSFGSAFMSFIVTVFGGVLCGAMVGGIVLLLIGRTTDHLVEIAFSMVAAFASFLIAEHFHLSGVLATMTTGILMGNIGQFGVLSDRGREAVVAFWEYIAFAANSLIFLLIGMALSKEGIVNVWAPIIVIGLLLIVGRAAAVYGCCAVFLRSAALRVSFSHQHILFWGGLRGALALALALNLPEGTPLKGTLAAVVFGVVGASIVAQGVTMTPLLRKLGEIPSTGTGDAVVPDLSVPELSVPELLVPELSVDA